MRFAEFRAGFVRPNLVPLSMAKRAVCWATFMAAEFVISLSGFGPGQFSRYGRFERNQSGIGVIVVIVPTGSNAEGISFGSSNVSLIAAAD